MTIGINATAAIKQPRTGVEEYTYQLIKHLTMLPEAREHRFILFVPAGTNLTNNTNNYTNIANNKIPPSPPLEKGGEEGIFDFSLPDNFVVKQLKWPLPFLWTQVRLAWEMFVRPPEVLFIPVHILPLIHPKNSVVTIHGLEYEYFPEYYPRLHRIYLRWSTKYALKQARKIIAISENTKRDLIKLYGGKVEKIEVVYHGIKQKISNFQFPISKQIPNSKFQISSPYILYLGRIEQKKNIEGILKAYKILKEKYQIPHQLVLAGVPGFGYDVLKFKIKDLLEIRNSKLEILELGYVSQDERRQLFANADIFLFPSFYEGFGLSVLEAQAAGVPVVTSFNSSLPEIAGGGALFVNPKNPVQIAQAVKNIIDDSALRDRLIESGQENIKRFGWERCARETLLRITNKYEYTDSG